MDIDKKTALKLVTDLILINGVSGDEGNVSKYICKKAMAAGVKRSWIFQDTAYKKTPANGNTGNLIITLPGTEKGPRIMFSAHMDTVEIARGSQPVIKGNFIYPKNKTALGADDRAGVAALLNTITTLKEKDTSSIDTKQLDEGMEDLL